MTQPVPTVSTTARRPPFDLILITEPELADPVTFMRRALTPLTVELGCRVAIQLRAKTWPPSQMLAAAHALRDLTRQHHATLLINGDARLCRQSDANGVQLPSAGPSIAETRAQIDPNAWIGASCHNADELLRASQQQADFVLLSPWAAVPNKAPALGSIQFAALSSRCPAPIYALGGIELANLESALTHGAHGVAVIRDVHQAADPADWVTRALSIVDATRPVAARDHNDASRSPAID